MWVFMIIHNNGYEKKEAWELRKQTQFNIRFKSAFLANLQTFLVKFFGDLCAKYFDFVEEILNRTQNEFQFRNLFVKIDSRNHWKPPSLGTWVFEALFECFEHFRPNNSWNQSFSWRRAGNYKKNTGKVYIFNEDCQ